MLNRDIRDRQKKAYDVGFLSGGGKHNGSLINIDSLLYNLRLHVNAYVEDRDILQNEIEYICKNCPKVLEYDEFKEILSSYKPFEKFANYFIDKYSK